MEGGSDAMSAWDEVFNGFVPPNAREQREIRADEERARRDAEKQRIQEKFPAQCGLRLVA